LYHRRTKLRIVIFHLVVTLSLGQIGIKFVGTPTNIERQVGKACFGGSEGGLEAQLAYVTPGSDSEMIFIRDAADSDVCAKHNMRWWNWSCHS
jgi:hypothetical protein